MKSDHSTFSRPRSSVVLVAHASFAPMLPKALESVRAQTRPADLVVVNNGAAQAVSEVLAQYPEAREIALADHARLGAAANAGVAEVMTDYVLRLDADDWLDETIIEQLEEAMADGVDCVWCDYYHAWPMPHGAWLMDPKEHHKQVLSCGALYRKAAWEKIGGYNPQMHKFDSHDFWQRFAGAGLRSIRVPRPLYFYRRGHASMSSARMVA